MPFVKSNCFQFQDVLLGFDGNWKFIQWNSWNGTVGTKHANVKCKLSRNGEKGRKGKVAASLHSIMLIRCYLRIPSPLGICVFVLAWAQVDPGVGFVSFDSGRHNNSRYMSFWWKAWEYCWKIMSLSFVSLYLHILWWNGVNHRKVMRELRKTSSELSRIRKWENIISWRIHKEQKICRNLG